MRVNGLEQRNAQDASASYRAPSARQGGAGFKSDLSFFLMASPVIILRKFSAPSLQYRVQSYSKSTGETIKKQYF